MNIKEAFVTRENPSEIFLIIDNVLSTAPDTQVFIDNAIYQELRKNGHNYHVYPHNYTKCFHYMHDDDNFGGEDWLALSKGCAFDDNIARGSFIHNTTDYVQLVEFHSSKVSDYAHFLAGFKQLLLIHFES